MIDVIKETLYQLLQALCMGFCVAVFAGVFYRKGVDKGVEIVTKNLTNMPIAIDILVQNDKCMLEMRLVSKDWKEPTRAKKPSKAN